MNPETKFLTEEFPTLIDKLSRSNPVNQMECCLRDFKNEVPRFQKKQDSLRTNAMKNTTKKLNDSIKCACRFENEVFSALERALGILKRRRKSLTLPEVDIRFDRQDPRISELENLLKSYKTAYKRYQEGFRDFDKGFQQAVKDPFFVTGGGYAALEKTLKPFEARFREWKQKFKDSLQKVRYDWVEYLLFEMSEYELKFAKDVIGKKRDNISQKTLSVVQAIQISAGIKQIWITSGFRDNQMQAEAMYEHFMKVWEKEKDLEVQVEWDKPYYKGKLFGVEEKCKSAIVKKEDRNTIIQSMTVDIEDIKDVPHRYTETLEVVDLSFNAHSCAEQVRLSNAIDLYVRVGVVSKFLDPTDPKSSSKVFHIEIPK